MQLALKLDAEQLKQTAFLESSRLKKKVAPQEVTVIKNAAGKVVRFKWRLPRTPKEQVKDAKQFEAQFQPSKMTALGQADI
jgi:hypothetical protein